MNAETDQRPFAKNEIAKFLDRKIDELKGVKSQRQIASETGYEKPNMISMFKRGDIKIPLDKIPSLAKAIETDPAHLFRLALEQYWPGLADTIQSIFGQVATKNEFELFLKPWRQATENLDPTPDEQLRHRIGGLLVEISGFIPKPRPAR